MASDCFTALKLTITLSEGSVSVNNVSAAAPSPDAATLFCDDEDDGSSNIPLLPAAISTPPFTTISLFLSPQSRGPFPLSVGPHTRTVPSFISIFPFESSPSPPAFT